MKYRDERENVKGKRSGLVKGVYLRKKQGLSEILGSLV
jgi:hypothetical protein